MGNTLLYKMIINLNVLTTIMLNRVDNKIRSRNIITEELDGSTIDKAQLSKQGSKRKSVVYRVGNNTILCCGRLGDNGLLFRALGDEITIKKDGITSGGAITIQHMQS